MTTEPTTFSELVDIFLDVIYTAYPVVIGLSIVVFLWGLAKFIFRVSGDEKAVGEGKKLMIWGIIALFIVLSLNAILSFFYTDIGFGGSYGLPLLKE
ncbi:MAG: hypothetical protein COV96_02455 [Candidatus Zambryskibacteria bacterium CG11_big_fil_rev_8_21_14_0_20_42_18]|uniref:Uncharacterized protein n=1 Tax=Candidatus Zambryskibacteria bacterium CG_4_9_14_3_um_filter_42_15 TaxID=1975112 RepID=A0A2M7WS97_9BACT|nr:MAG: hypothetical protein COV96_02455 [Candidatus Zambryskibacteria bacterium CG11_big_fil_rev_8_21_14_0_20_42_18]PJA32880.1 MAG: hypothetical protein CO185_01380 [Candidatus Zambryskibacteria bacterium CG_4_9_14_3_um_filter_42_15]